MAKQICRALTMACVLLFALAMIALPECEAQPKEIVVGATVSLTGPAAGFGEGGTFGLKAAVEDINKLGGIFVKEYNAKLPVKLVVLDNESDPIKAGTFAQDLIVREKANFIVCPPLWPHFIASIATVTERQKTPFIAYAGPFEPNNALREAGGGWKYTWSCGFAIGMPPDPGYFTEGVPGYTLIDCWVDYLNKFAAQTNKKVAVFASDEPDGRGWYSSFPGMLQGAGFEMFGVDRELGISPLDTTDFTPTIKEWKDNNCEIMVGNAPGTWFGTLWRQRYSL